MTVDLLELAATRLDPLLDELVFVGGATITLWITEAAAPPTRTTEDVDVICGAMSYADYVELSRRMRDLGFREAADSRVLCRWVHPDHLVVDLIPQSEEVLGFANRWYGLAVATAVEVRLPSSRRIRAVTPAMTLATKLEAWRGRGDGDVVRSLDVHDIVVLANGRPELGSEVNEAPGPAAEAIRRGIEELLGLPYFDYVIQAAVSGYGRAAPERHQIVRERLEQLAGAAG